jgi:hypothetical protein
VREREKMTRKIIIKDIGPDGKPRITEKEISSNKPDHVLENFDNYRKKERPERPERPPRPPKPPKPFRPRHHFGDEYNVITKTKMFTSTADLVKYVNEEGEENNHIDVFKIDDALYKVVVSMKKEVKE